MCGCEASILLLALAVISASAGTVLPFAYGASFVFTLGSWGGLGLHQAPKHGYLKAVVLGAFFILAVYSSLGAVAFGIAFVAAMVKLMTAVSSIDLFKYAPVLAGKAVLLLSAIKRGVVVNSIGGAAYARQFAFMPAAGLAIGLLALASTTTASAGTAGLADSSDGSQLIWPLAAAGFIFLGMSLAMMRLRWTQH